MSQKNVSNIVQCNTVSFSKNAHETGVQRYRTTSDRSHTVPFRFVSYRSAEYRAKSKCRSFRRRKTASLEHLSLPSHVFHALSYEEKPREAVLENGCSPARAMASPSDDLRSIVKARA